MAEGQNERPADPDLPELSLLLGPEAEDLLGGLLAELGARLVSSRIMQVRYVPGRSVTVQYRVEAEQRDGGGKTREIFVASAGIDVPDHVPVLTADGIEIAVWRFPYDPFLPGLAPATDPDQIRGVLEQLGVTTEQVRLSTRAYRPGRRAVIEVVSPQARIFLKVLRPSRIADLQRIHGAMAGSVPVPHSLGWSEDLGLVAMQAMRGRTLRKALESGTKRLPEAAQLRSLLELLPTDPAAPAVTGPRRHATSHAALLKAVTPQFVSRIDAIVDAVAGEPDEPTVAVHGDFHTSQVLVKGAEIVGLIDVDTVGVGYRSDDYGSILGHLATLSL
ncbi:MAG: phosphotransferase, partial [Acidimicrobiia bacterium]